MLNEQRTNPRKILKVKAVLAMEGQALLLVRTTDIASNGLSMTVPHPLQAGQTGQLSFDLLVDGKPVPLQLRCKVAYCIVSHGDFKVGVQFVNLDATAIKHLTRFMR